MKDHMTDVRECVAYDTFRKGCRKKKPPLWQDLEPWMRDAIRVAYLQGRLDGVADDAKYESEYERKCAEFLRGHHG